MKFFFIILIFFVVIVSNKLFLFNEEFLICLSFVIFCFLVYENLKISIQQYFATKIHFLQQCVIISVDKIKMQLIQKNKLKKQFVVTTKNLFLLKRHYLSFSKKFLNTFLKYLNIKEDVNLLKKLNEFSFLEINYPKLIILLFFKKVLEIVFITKFFKSQIQIKRFQTLTKINMIHLIKKI